MGLWDTLGDIFGWLEEKGNELQEEKDRIESRAERRYNSISQLSREEKLEEFNKLKIKNNRSKEDLYLMKLIRDDL